MRTPRTRVRTSGSELAFRAHRPALSLRALRRVLPRAPARSRYSSRTTNGARQRTQVHVPEDAVLLIPQEPHEEGAGSTGLGSGMEISVQQPVTETWSSAPRRFERVWTVYEVLPAEPGRWSSGAWPGRRSFATFAARSSPAPPSHWKAARATGWSQAAAGCRTDTTHRLHGKPGTRRGLWRTRQR